MAPSAKGLLTPTRCRALAAISRRGPSTSAELAAEFGMRSKASLTRTLRGLTGAGLLVRTTTWRGPTATA